MYTKIGGSFSIAGAYFAMNGIRMKMTPRAIISKPIQVKG
jgi:hypothetical protein